MSSPLPEFGYVLKSNPMSKKHEPQSVSNHFLTQEDDSDNQPKVEICCFSHERKQLEIHNLCTYIFSNTI